MEVVRIQGPIRGMEVVRIQGPIRGMDVVRIQGPIRGMDVVRIQGPIRGMDVVRIQGPIRGIVPFPTGRHVGSFPAPQTRLRSMKHCVCVCGLLLSLIARCLF